MPEIRLGELAEKIGATLTNGDPEQKVSRLAALAEAGPGSLSFLSNPAYKDQLASTRAEAVVVSRGVSGSSAALLQVDNPDLGFAKASMLIVPPTPHPKPGIHPTAIVAESATLGVDVSVGAGAVIAPGAVIGNRTVIYPQVYIGVDSRVGEDCLFYPQVVVYHQISIGSRCIIHAGAVIGSDGFGFAWTGKDYFKVPQAGTVVVEDDVEIGANTCIDRARFGETHLGAGSKLDNLVQVAHNVVIGNSCAFASHVAIAGSTTIGNFVRMGGNSVTVGHMRIGDGVTVLGQAGISKNVPGVDSGAAKDQLIWVESPAKALPDQLREWRDIKSLGRLRKTVKELEERLARLEKEKV